MSFPATHIWFDANDLSAISNVNITRLTPQNTPDMVSGQFDLANRDGGKLLTKYYRNKTIVVEGYILSTTRATAETARDNLLDKTTGLEKTLEFMQAGSIRRYYATLTGTTFAELEGGMMSFVLTFSCADPFGYKPTYTTNTKANQTTANWTWAYTIAGTWNATPLLRFTINGLHNTFSDGLLQISRYDSATATKYETITIYRDWTSDNGKVIEIDCVNQTVKLAGQEIDYWGTFFDLPKGSGAIRCEQYDSTFASNYFLELSSYMEYNERYL
ncbi:hypothetical protein [Polynucleobacter sp.]|uniref:hypothetical protein n=1 Tax=Polynucleobacter sp. TaxID=2029855 RepID=UPI003F6A1F51